MHNKRLYRMFKKEHPETIGETDQCFDSFNYKDWLEVYAIKLETKLEEQQGNTEISKQSDNSTINVKMNKFKKYRRKNISEMRPYIEGEKLDDNVSISDADLKAGSPKVGDMIARNPNNHNDQWLVSKAYFKDNLELID